VTVEALVGAWRAAAGIGAARSVLQGAGAAYRSESMTGQAPAQGSAAGPPLPPVHSEVHAALQSGRHGMWPFRRCSERNEAATLRVGENRAAPPRRERERSGPHGVGRGPVLGRAGVGAEDLRRGLVTPKTCFSNNRVKFDLFKYFF